MLKEFREFAMKGNMVDLAVGIIIGAAFGAIVTSLVGDIIMPIIGAITGGLDFSNYFTPLSKSVTASNLADAKKEGAVQDWGLTRAEEPLTEIRDLLKSPDVRGLRPVDSAAGRK